MRLLVQSLIRIFGIFYCVKAIDSSAVSIYSYILQRTQLPSDLVEQMPHPLTLLIPTILIYLIIAFGLFLSAPLLSRMIIPHTDSEEMKCGSLDLAIITSSAMLIAGWVFIRIIDEVYGLISIYIQDEEVTINDATSFYMLTNLVLLLACFLAIKKMPKIMKHLKSAHKTS